MVFYHFLGTVVPLCTPHILADIVVEIDMGTQVITHSPNAKHYAAHIVAIYCYLASGSRPLLANFPRLSYGAVQIILFSLSHNILIIFCNFI